MYRVSFILLKYSNHAVTNLLTDDPVLHQGEDCYRPGCIPRQKYQTYKKTKKQAFHGVSSNITQDNAAQFKRRNAQD